MLQIRFEIFLNLVYFLGITLKIYLKNLLIRETHTLRMTLKNPLFTHGH